MIKTGDVVSKKGDALLDGSTLLIVYDDLGDNSLDCFVLPIDLTDGGKRPIRILKTELQAV